MLVGDGPELKYDRTGRRFAAGMTKTDPGDLFRCSGVVDGDRVLPRSNQLFFLAATDRGLPPGPFLTWRRRDGLDLFFFRLFGFPISFLFTFGHVDLFLDMMMSFWSNQDWCR